MAVFCKKRIVIILVMIVFTTCDDFVEVDLPQNQLETESVFKDVTTATAALKSIYSNMRDTGVVYDLSVNMGYYADELEPFSTQPSFYFHTISALDNQVASWWSSTYNTIYAANNVLQGVDNSTFLSLEDKNQIKGEVLFVRAYLHMLLVELFGPIPYIATPDYITNTSVNRIPEEEVYIYIKQDLILASELLGEDISVAPEERIRPYKAVAEALLSRMYLYTEDWINAEVMASSVIDKFIWESDLDKVFLKNSSGTIWQFKPALEEGNSSEGSRFIFIANPGLKPILSSSILNAFEPSLFGQPGDRRRFKWVKGVSTTTGNLYHAYKYKEENTTFLSDGETPDSKEYSVIFRLAEQYLIRAEARAYLGNIEGAQEDLNMIRTRAELSNTTATTTNDLLDAILDERQVELFTEGGHRWFDLKRTGRAAGVLEPIKPGWRDTDILLPIPEDELLLNPNLLPQNEGY